MSTTAWKLGGWGGSDAVARATKRSSSSSRSRSLCRRSKPIVDETFMSMPGPPHSEPPRWPGPDLDAVGQRQELLVQRVEDRARALLLVDGQVGPRDVADEQRVAGEHRPRLAAAGRVDQREGGVLGPVAGRVHRAHAHGAQLRAPSRRRTARGRSPARALAVDVDDRAGGGRPGARARRRGRRGCASRGCARSTRPCSGRGSGTRRSRAWDRRPRRRRRARRR